MVSLLNITIFTTGEIGLFKLQFTFWSNDLPDRLLLSAKQRASKVTNATIETLNNIVPETKALKYESIMNNTVMVCCYYWVIGN